MAAMGWERGQNHPPLLSCIIAKQPRKKYKNNVKQPSFLSINMV